MTDYSKYPTNNKFYTGAEKKIGLAIGSNSYFIKFQKNSPEGLRYNHVSEYIGSHMFDLLGIPVQDTYLGTYKGQKVVLVRDFLEDGETFIPFTGVGDSSLEENKNYYTYEYQDITNMMRDNLKLTNIMETEDRFWDMFVVDALLGNFDRHGSNWGFIKKENFYRIAPVFDNGSCLFPQLNSDEKIERVLNSAAEMEKRIYQFPTSQIRYKGKKSSYYEIINSMQFEQCNQAVKRIVERYNENKVEKLLENTIFI